MASFKYSGDVARDAVAKRNFKKSIEREAPRTIALVSGANRISHGLGKKPVGRRVVGQSTAATLSAESFDSKFWYVTASADITLQIEFIEAT